MSKQKIYEHATLTEGKSDKGTYRVRVISEGEGSSGVYSRQLLEGQADVFSDSASFFNHPVDPTKPWDRKVEGIAGRLIGKTWAEEDAEGVVGIYGDYKPGTAHREWFEEYKDIIGLSVYIEAAGEKNDAGKVVVESFNEIDPYRSVDVVVAAGRGGRFERATESLRAINGDAITFTPVIESKENPAMELAELAAKVDTLQTSVEGLMTSVSTIVETLKPQEPSEVDVAANAESVVKANLPEASRKIVLGHVAEADFADVLKTHTDLVSSITESLTGKKGTSTVVEGRVVTGVVSENAADYLPKGW